MPPGRRASPRRFIVAALIAVAILLSIPFTLTSGLRERLEAALGERFDGDVQIESLRVSALPRLRVAGAGLVLRPRGRTDVPPLISIASFSADANLWGIVGRPIRLERVRLEGLEINIPPGGIDLENGDESPDTPDEARREPSPEEAARAAPGRSPIFVGDLLAERAVLRILRRDPEKEPRVWEIEHLSMERAGSNDPWPFQARLTNPIPPGELDVRGTFGPWNAPRPSNTPLAAAYEFRNADLGFFDGIQGILTSTGEFSGVLDRIEVRGQTETPEFALDDVGQAVPLTTEFTAIVDGTSGNTWLKPVRATLGTSSFVATGGIVEPDGQKGRTVSLDVEMSDARIEDVLRLAVKGTPALAGGLKLKTKLELPPGTGKAIEKLRLDGSFAIASARFSEGGLQAKMNELSQKAQGEGDSAKPPDRVASDFSGRYTMRDGAIRFSSLAFSVPGARLDLTGTYAIRAETLDFRGTVRMDARLSQLTTGFKSFLLKMVDPLVRRKDLTVIPITIGGTAEKPEFGLDVRRTLTRK
jgi:hypothetical protein